MARKAPRPVGYRPAHVKAAILRRYETAAAFAKAAGLGKSTVGRWITEDPAKVTMPDAPGMRQLAKLTGLPIGALFGEDPRDELLGYAQAMLDPEEFEAIAHALRRARVPVERHVVTVDDAPVLVWLSGGSADARAQLLRRLNSEPEKHPDAEGHDGDGKRH